MDPRTPVVLLHAFPLNAAMWTRPASGEPWWWGSRWGDTRRSGSTRGRAVRAWGGSPTPWSRLLGETTRREQPDVVARVRELVAQAQPEGVARALEAMRGRADSLPRLGEIRVPVLVVVGAEYTLTPPDESRKIAEGVSDGRLVVLPGAGHLANLEAPEAFDAALEGWLG